MKQMTKNAVILSVTFLASLASLNARAEFSFLCGEGREKGAEHAEIAFVDSLDAGAMKLFLNGAEVPDEKLGFKALDGGRWIVSIEHGDGSRKFLFQQGASASVQESIVDGSGNEKKAGPRKKCDFKQGES